MRTRDQIPRTQPNILCAIKHVSNPSVSMARWEVELGNPPWSLQASQPAMQWWMMRDSLSRVEDEDRFAKWSSCILWLRLCTWQVHIPKTHKQRCIQTIHTYVKEKRKTIKPDGNCTFAYFTKKAKTCPNEREMIFPFLHFWNGKGVSKTRELWIGSQKR